MPDKWYKLQMEFANGSTRFAMMSGDETDAIFYDECDAHTAARAIAFVMETFAPGFKAIDVIQYEYHANPNE